MTAAEKRAKVAALHKQVVAQKNIYSQNATKRECVLKKHSDKKYYSDCSSAARKITEESDPSVKPMGGNTVAQYQNKKAITVDCKIVNGVPTNISALRVGDCLYFAGTDTSRAYADYVGHVEQIHAIDGNKVTLFGHGSGNPKYTDMAMFCKSRQNAKTSTKKGNKGLLKVLRFIKDDTEPVQPAPPTQPTKGIKITGNTVNVRTTPDLTSKTNIAFIAKKGEVYEDANPSDCRMIKRNGKTLYVSNEMSERVQDRWEN